MSRGSVITLYGLYTWEADLFSLMDWPDAFTGDEPILSKETFVNNLLMETINLEVLFPDPEIMKNAIRNWSQKNKAVYNHLIQTTMYQYNPIENYDRTEDGTDTTRHTGTDSHLDTITHTGADTTVNDPVETERSVGAFDSVGSGQQDGLVKKEKEISKSTTTQTYGSTDGHNGSVTHGHVETLTHGLHVHGNIGTVTAQAMITQEREIAEFNIYNRMIKDFKSDFCNLVY